MFNTKEFSTKWQDVAYTENSEDMLFVTSENVSVDELLLSNKKYVEKNYQMEP